MPKKKIKKQAWGFVSSNQSPDNYLQEVNKYIVKKQWSNAKKRLEEIEQRFPCNKDIFYCWLTLASEQNNWMIYQKKAQEFISKYPNEADVYLALSTVCLKNTYPILALQVLQDFCDKFPNHSEISEAKETIKEIKITVPQLLQDYKLEKEKVLEIGKLAEQGRFLFEIGEYDQAKNFFQDLITLAPTFLPALNNQSIILSREGKLTEAIALAQKVLEQEQNNFQALGNLVHFYVLLGETELAETHLKKLMTSDNNILDIWLKKAEALSFFGDYEGLIKLGQQAEKSELLKDLTAPFWHWIAVAYTNLGEENKARQLWQKALKISSDFSYAQENLENIKLPVGERNTPWSFELSEWIPSTVIDDMRRMIEDDSQPNKTDKSIAKQILKNYPQIIPLVPILLKRGSPLARKFAINISISTQNPELLSSLKEFVFSNYGTDQERLETANQMNQQGLIPSGNIKLWIQGKEQEILLMGMEINDQPSVIHSKPVQKMAQRAILALKNEKPEEAESMLLEALELEPSAPDLRFNLANAYMLQGQEKKANELVRKIHEEHPDYVFATIMLARLHLENRELETAEELLKPLLQKKQFNYQEFDQLCQTHIQLSIKKKVPEAAHSWLGLWKQIADEDNPSLNYWINRLENKSSWFLK
jgi:tetratricopeptide (TPR) repeat protein